MADFSFDRSIEPVLKNPSYQKLDTQGKINVLESYGEEFVSTAPEQKNEILRLTAYRKYQERIADINREYNKLPTNAPEPFRVDTQFDLFEKSLTQKRMERPELYGGAQPVVNLEGDYSDDFRRGVSQGKLGNSLLDARLKEAQEAYEGDFVNASADFEPVKIGTDRGFYAIAKPKQSIRAEERGKFEVQTPTGIIEVDSLDKLTPAQMDEVKKTVPETLDYLLRRVDEDDDASRVLDSDAFKDLSSWQGNENTMKMVARRALISLESKMGKVEIPEDGSLPNVDELTLRRTKQANVFRQMLITQEAREALAVERPYTDQFLDVIQRASDRGAITLMSMGDSLAFRSNGMRLKALEQQKKDLAQDGLGVKALDDRIAEVKKDQVRIARQMFLAQDQSSFVGTSAALQRFNSRSKDIKDFKSFMEVTGDDFFTWTTDAFVESTVSQLPVMLVGGPVARGATAAYGAVGGAVAVGALAGVSEGAVGYTEALNTALKENGYEPTDAKSFTEGLTNADVVARANDISIKRASVIGLTNGAFYALSKPFLNVIDRTLVNAGAASSRAATVSGVLGTNIAAVAYEPVTEATGEYLAQLGAGTQVDIGSIILEGLSSTGLGSVGEGPELLTRNNNPSLLFNREFNVLQEQAGRNAEIDAEYLESAPVVGMSIEKIEEQAAKNLEAAKIAANPDGTVDLTKIPQALLDAESKAPQNRPFKTEDIKGTSDTMVVMTMPDGTTVRRRVHKDVGALMSKAVARLTRAGNLASIIKETPDSLSFRKKGQTYEITRDSLGDQYDEAVAALKAESKRVNNIKAQDRWEDVEVYQRLQRDLERFANETAASDAKKKNRSILNSDKIKVGIETVFAMDKVIAQNLSIRYNLPIFPQDVAQARLEKSVGTSLEFSGKIGQYNPTANQIKFYGNADITTFLEEFDHQTLDLFGSLLLSPAEQQELDTLLQAQAKIAAKKDKSNPIKTLVGKFGTGVRTSDGGWTEVGQEVFANLMLDFRQKSGDVAMSPSLKALLTKLHAYQSEVFAEIGNQRFTSLSLEGMDFFKNFYQLPSETVKSFFDEVEQRSRVIEDNEVDGTEIANLIFEGKELPEQSKMNGPIQVGVESIGELLEKAEKQTYMEKPVRHVVTALDSGLSGINPKNQIKMMQGKNAPVTLIVDELDKKIVTGVAQNRKGNATKLKDAINGTVRKFGLSEEEATKYVVQRADDLKALAKSQATKDEAIVFNVARFEAEQTMPSPSVTMKEAQVEVPTVANPPTTERVPTNVLTVDGTDVTLYLSPEQELEALRLIPRSELVKTGDAIYTGESIYQANQDGSWTQYSFGANGLIVDKDVELPTTVINDDRAELFLKEDFDAAYEEYIADPEKKLSTLLKEKKNARSVEKTTEEELQDLSTASQESKDAAIKKWLTAKGFIKKGGGLSKKKRPSWIRTEEEDRVRNQYAGTRSKLPRRALNTAKKLDAEGKDSEFIRQLTGWFKGPYDGLWRYELDTSGVKIKKLPKRFEPKPGGATPVDQATLKLSEVIDFPALFKAYPRLNDIVVMNLDHKGDAVATFLPKHWAIVYDGRVATFQFHPPSLIKVLLHEVQHAIQEIENFAKGGTMDKRSRAEYRSLAGEIEARDIEARVSMTMEERKEKTPFTSEDVNREDVRVLYQMREDRFQRREAGFSQEISRRATAGLSSLLKLNDYKQLPSSELAKVVEERFRSFDDIYQALRDFMKLVNLPPTKLDEMFYVGEGYDATGFAGLNLYGQKISVELQNLLSLNEKGMLQVLPNGMSRDQIIAINEALVLQIEKQHRRSGRVGAITKFAYETTPEQLVLDVKLKIANSEGRFNKLLADIRDISKGQGEVLPSDAQLLKLLEEKGYSKFFLNTAKKYWQLRFKGKDFEADALKAFQDAGILGKIEKSREENILKLATVLNALGKESPQAMLLGPMLSTAIHRELGLPIGDLITAIPINTWLASVKTFGTNVIGFVITNPINYAVSTVTLMGDIAKQTSPAHALQTILPAMFEGVKRSVFDSNAQGFALSDSRYIIAGGKGKANERLEKAMGYARPMSAVLLGKPGKTDTILDSTGRALLTLFLDSGARVATVADAYARALGQESYLARQLYANAAIAWAKMSPQERANTKVSQSEYIRNSVDAGLGVKDYPAIRKQAEAFVRNNAQLFVDNSLAFNRQNPKVLENVIDVLSYYMVMKEREDRLAELMDKSSEYAYEAAYAGELSPIAAGFEGFINVLAELDVNGKGWSTIDEKVGTMTVPNQFKVGSKTITLGKKSFRFRLGSSPLKVIQPFVATPLRVVDEMANWTMLTAVTKTGVRDVLDKINEGTEGYEAMPMDRIIQTGIKAVAGTGLMVLAAMKVGAGPDDDDEWGLSGGQGITYKERNEKDGVVPPWSIWIKTKDGVAIIRYNQAPQLMATVGLGASIAEDLQTNPKYQFAVTDQDKMEVASIWAGSMLVNTAAIMEDPAPLEGALMFSDLLSIPQDGWNQPRAQAALNQTVRPFFNPLYRLQEEAIQTWNFFHKDETIPTASKEDFIAQIYVGTLMYPVVRQVLGKELDESVGVRIDKTTGEPANNRVFPLIQPLEWKRMSAGMSFLLKNNLRIPDAPTSKAYYQLVEGEQQRKYLIANSENAKNGTFTMAHLSEAEARATPIYLEWLTAYGQDSDRHSALQDFATSETNRLYGASKNSPQTYRSLLEKDITKIVQTARQIAYLETYAQHYAKTDAAKRLTLGYANKLKRQGYKLGKITEIVEEPSQ